MTCNDEGTSVVIFAYNRPRHLRELYNVLQGLEIGKRYCVHIFHDGPKIDSDYEVLDSRTLTETFIGTLQDFEVTLNDNNLGLANSIKRGLDSVFNAHNRAIILEDDIIPSQGFFDLVQHFLESEASNTLIGSVAGANTTRFPFFVRRKYLLSRRHSSWGWATWADRWKSINWDYVEQELFQDKELLQKVRNVSPDLVGYAELQREKKIDSWATGMNIDFIRRNLLCVVPKENYINNIGFDGSGTHVNDRQKKIHNIVKSPHKTFEVPKHIELKESYFYNLAVRKNHSLLRDFPKGSLMRVILKMRTRLLKTAT